MTKSVDKLISLADSFEHKMGADFRFKDEVVRTLAESARELKSLADHARRRAEIAIRNKDASTEALERNQHQVLSNLEGKLKLVLEMLVKY